MKGELALTQSDSPLVSLADPEGRRSLAETEGSESILIRGFNTEAGLLIVRLSILKSSSVRGFNTEAGLPVMRLSTLKSCSVRRFNTEAGLSLMRLSI